MARETLKALIRKKRTLRDYFSLQYEGDRAFAIVSSSILEDNLEFAILSRFVDLSQRDIDYLFKGDAPLATFSAKIKIAFALGVFNVDVRADLNCIRDIRNAFAHARRSIDFNTLEIAAACEHLKSWKLAQGPKTAGSAISPRDTFDLTCLAIYCTLSEDGQLWEIQMERERRRTSREISPAPLVQDHPPEMSNPPKLKPRRRSSRE